MFTKAVILAFVAVAVAVSTNQEGQGDTCASDGGILYCCDSETAKQLTNPGPISTTADLQNLLGQCNEVTVPVLGAAVPVKAQCSQQAVCCGEINQNVRSE